MAVRERLRRWAGRIVWLLKRGAGSRNIDFRKLEEILKYSIHNRQLFSEALSHRSYLQIVGNENAISNERLEFLGDAILNLAVAEYLYRRYITAPEGELTKIRARLVNRKALSIYAHHIRLADFLLMSPSASQVAGKGMDTILADAYEAIIGAIYLDGGFHHAQQFVEQTILTALERGLIKTEDENFKSQLLEHAQATGYGAPRYLTINEEGPDHDRTFTVEVFIGSESYGVGRGKNKKDAEQAAAEQALQQLNLL
ncbi:MAG: ribonuclease III [Ignavibacteria bacterium]|nr:ribonuclease III [Ignavibacteria bacterium]